MLLGVLAIHHKLNPISSLRAFSALIICIGLATLGTHWVINFSYGAHIMFCSAFLFVILNLFGPYWSGAAVLIVSAISYFWLDGPIYLILICIEVILVSAVFSRKRKRFLFIWDGLFWLIIGAPLTGLLYYLQIGIYSSEMYLQIFMIAMSGLLNGLLGDVIITYLPWRRLFPQMKKRMIYLNQLLTHLSIVAVIGPFLLNMYLDSSQIRDRVEHDSLLFMQTQTQHMMNEMNRMERESKGSTSKIKESIQSGEITEELVRNSANGAIKMGLLYADNNIASSTDGDWFRKQYYTVFNNGLQHLSSSSDSHEVGYYKTGLRYASEFYRWIPENEHYNYETWRWNNGYYVLVTEIAGFSPNQIVAALPISYYQHSTIMAYTNKFIVMFSFCMIATIISLFFNSYLMLSLNKLTKMTTDLPDKLKRQQVFAWPRTAIHEVAALVTNFRIMADRVVEMFLEMRRMNDQLIEQTEMLELSEERLQQLAYYDTLTGLPNRYHFSLDLERSLEESVKSNQTLAVMFIDLDRFKHVNDTLGHDVGDLLLTEVSQRLDQIFRDSTQAMCARLGGDEFVVVLRDVERSNVNTYAEAIIEKLSLGFHVQSHELFVAASIGVSLFPQDGDSLTSMLKNADTAMYVAKDKGGSCYQYYDQITVDQIPERMMLENHLRKALERDEMLLYYQPLLDEKGTIIAAEALIRWSHPMHGFVSPAQFIPLAEETGLIIPIGEWVLRTACMQHLIWVREGLPKIQMSVNVSLRQFSNQDFVQVVDRVIEETGMDPKYLILEITEGYVQHHMEHAISVLGQLKERGIQIAIDDFGTGYSSLSRLHKLPIHILKLDQSFVRHLPTDEVNASIVKTVIQLGHSLDVAVAAEGIETEEELQFLQSQGCDKFQGYLFSRPIPAAQFIATFADFNLKKNLTS
ncbi:hypothetical protein BVG16_19730 [Paenibacillus selenitireducens]|uniref:GGDEF-domain containing protein n=1 Tax=Paenibacillus selenitireducens TaxID=1324314 RepID=A0A1T2X6Y1_9BACL|nr:EAL domain-containing protein [Paenibacillus selenitireducens]OPA75575.1 hypothetical protein BVG16_19730 [Paenibacillus selenitireducens]